MMKMAKQHQILQEVKAHLSLGYAYNIPYTDVHIGANWKANNFNFRKL